jgi:putative transposase
MNFEKDRIFHVYNQGNNRQPIFFDESNYLFFLKKMHTHILPYADFLAWCLMPNHFHWMIYIKETELPAVSVQEKPKNKKFIIKNDGIKQVEKKAKITNLTTLNQSIGTSLASYTRAINIQEGFTGSLFRKNTKGICLNDNSLTLKAWVESLGITIINRDIPENQYTKQCFDYIHQNPVKAGLVKKPEEWEFSSYKDVIGIRNGKLINRNLIRELGLMEGIN